MRVTVLGSGTSAGVPMIACGCAVCRSDHPRNRRTRASIRVETAGKHFLVDTTPDLREQALREGVTRVDAVLWTHGHADHMNGLDDLRAFNFAQKGAIHGWADAETARLIRRNFDYIWDDGAQAGGGKPAIELEALGEDFRPLGVAVTPLPVKHGRLDVTGFRFGRFAYVTDLSLVPPETEAKLGGLDVLLLGALRPRPHPTHLCFEEALEVVARVRPRLAYFTHLN
ncbi:MAG: MBL fold metallo-hydrolase, partial [Candidatus Methylomirabilis sp.]|nr:MBL fold metallo-hydrolase [Deltaproteobacteria bacterium]